MQGKAIFLLGAAAGYVFGTRAGREGYERLKKRASSLWHSRGVQDGVSSAGAFAREKLPVVGDTLNTAAHRAGDAVTGALHSQAEAPGSSTSPGDGGDTGGHNG